MIIYVDILLFINTIINYAILMTTEKMMKRSCRLYRLILGSVTGALFSLLIFCELNKAIVLFFLKILSSGIIALITFGWHSRREYIKVTLCLVTVSVIYSGAFILFYQIFKPPNMIIVNNVVYLQVNPLWLTALTGFIYLLVIILYKLFSERIKCTVVPLRFVVYDREYSCIAKIDTGCNLREPFSSAPVIIVDQTVMKTDTEQPYRIIPYTTVGGSSYLNAVKAKAVVIDDKEIKEDTYIAGADLHNTNYQAIINSEIIR